MRVVGRRGVSGSVGFEDGSVDLANRADNLAFRVLAGLRVTGRRVYAAQTHKFIYRAPNLPLKIYLLTLPTNCPIILSPIILSIKYTSKQINPTCGLLLSAPYSFAISSAAYSLCPLQERPPPALSSPIPSPSPFSSTS